MALCYVCAECLCCEDCVYTHICDSYDCDCEHCTFECFEYDLCEDDSTVTASE